MSTIIIIMIGVPVFAFSALMFAVARVLWNCTVDLTVNLRENDDYYVEESEEEAYQK